tara:strand:+ start:617 stop:739 length:123 start_codon:yes stop_codon:yes gene_type:complete
VVDKMGMGDHIVDQLEHIHQGILGTFGMGDILKVNFMLQA